MISFEDVRELALSLPGAEEVEHWGKPSFRINNKIFTVLQEDGATLTVKISREIREVLTAAEPAAYRVPETFSNLNYMHINLEAAPEESVRQLVRSAWGLVAPKKMVKAYFQEAKSAGD